MHNIHNSNVVNSADENNNINNNNQLEPILDPTNRQFTIYPIKYEGIWKLYKYHEASFWKAEEIDFSNDYTDFCMLNGNEQTFIKRILAFFAASDGIVNFNISNRFVREVQIIEATVFYQFQTMMENIHGETYSLQLTTLIPDAEERSFLLNAIQNIPEIKNMADWAFKWIESPSSFAYRLVAFACIECIFFSGAFAAIFWIKKYKPKGNHSNSFMNGLVKSNQYIARDEGLHCVFATELYKLLKQKLEKEQIYKIVNEAVLIAKSFMISSLKTELIGINNKLMSEYIEYVADMLISMLKYPKLFETQNPFKFMETIGLHNKNSFFESRSTEYQDAYVLDPNPVNNEKICIDDDF